MVPEYPTFYLNDSEAYFSLSDGSMASKLK